MAYIVNQTPVPDLPDRESALLFQAIAEAADYADLGVLITRSNPDATKLELVYFNPTLERMTGRTRSEIMEVGGLLPFLPPEERSLLHHLNVARIRGEHLPARFTSAFKHKTGHLVPFEATLVPILLGSQSLNVSFL